MSKKDKKIEIQIVDHKVLLENTLVNGYQLLNGKRIVGEIAELDERFVVVNNGSAESFFKTLEQAVESIIESYNLNH
ncbi:DUF2969 domain-containing protein [Streptococcus porcinus]|uniref:DUF2969 domain-containing protein n=1 Tax=Streptococcus porcinus TaxID=1340 RepID=A0A7V9WT51_STRPO|nr:DUF2969 domain-containing protein [Streptococcus porcinus]MBA2796602.1 DUF2969 domain-containing protein [Streptococcus porcinus]